MTKNFSIHELTRTENRDPEILLQQSNLPNDVVENLKNLCVNVLEPWRNLIGPIRITSGYRCPRLNAAVGGALNSAHMNGRAADCYPINMGIYQAIGALRDSNIGFDKAILEFGRWIHVQIANVGQKPRKLVLAAKFSGTDVVYEAVS